MEKIPQFIKDFSKKESPDERQQTAQAIRTKRAEYFTEKSAQTERHEELQQATGEREQSLAEQLEVIGNLENKIAELSNTGLGKILNYFQLKKLQADIIGGQKTYDELRQQQEVENTEQQEISEKLKQEEIQPALQEEKVMLDDFYQDQKEKWTNSEYTKEDITKYFSEEKLASLSLEDYTLLLKRFPSEMVAHVTRQGIRDHIGMMYHTAGEGVYADGFMKMVEDGRLRSPLGVRLVESEKDKAIANFLRLDSFESKKEALNHLDTITDVGQGEPGTYVDSMAIHFATEEVADTFYGSEKGNEIFITYPSAYIASQYYFSGQLNKGSGSYWNDQWVWANEENGIDLNAGLVFIPEEAKVDKKTGSRYELDENKNPVKNSEYQIAFRKVVDSVDFYDFASQVIEITGKLSQYKEGELPEKLEPFCQKLEQKFGITDPRLQRAILDYSNLSNLSVYKKLQEDSNEDQFHTVDSAIEEAMKEEGILFSEAKDVISSKEFWETYFAENPAKRPSKIVYYKGIDPTTALNEWRKEHDISKNTEDNVMGFSEHNVERDAPQAISGLDRFKSLSEKVIEDYFAKKDVSN